MIRAHKLTRAPALRTAIRCQAAAAAPPKTTPAPAAVAPTAKQVKFLKEDVSSVMSELPEFNFYELKEGTPNPYNMNTMDHSILLDPVQGSLAPGKVEYSVLENGLRVASIDRQGLNASLGLHVSAGSRFEDASNFGVSHATALMAYKSTAHLSNLRTVKVLEQLGCNYTATCTAGREDITYSVNVMREFMPLAVPLLVGNVLFPRLLPWEVKAAQEGVALAADNLAADPDASVNAMLHQAAYCNNTLGRSPLATGRTNFTPDTVRSFMLDHFAPERMVLTGVNVPHDELAKWAMRSFVDYNAIPLKDRAATKATYTGGSLIADGDSPFCHLAIGLESAKWGSDLPAVSVLRALLGNGSAVQAPGSGVTSRLSNLAARNGAIQSVSAFNSTYSDSGLFGVYAVCEPAAAGAVATEVAKALAGMATASADEINKAKQMLKGSLLRQVDDSAAIGKDLGTQMLLSGTYASPAEFCATIDGVTAAQVSAAAKSILSSKPTVVGFGDTHAVPHYSVLEAALK